MSKGDSPQASGHRRRRGQGPRLQSFHESHQDFLDSLHEVTREQVMLAETQVVGKLTSVLMHESALETKGLNPPAHPAPGQVDPERPWVAKVLILE